MSAPPISRLVGERQVSVVRDAAAVWRVLDDDPIESCMVAARVADHGIDPNAIGGELWTRRGAHESLCFAGANLIPLRGGPIDLNAFADVAMSTPRRCSSLVGRADLVLPMWQRLEPVWGPARDVRDNQPLMALATHPSCAIDTGVRQVRPEELDSYLVAAVDMFIGEVGVDPRLGDGGRGYRRRVAGLIAAGRAWARFEHGQVIFKAEVGSQSPAVGQIQGVWVHPEWRGIGLGTAGTATLAAVIVGSGRIASLYGTASTRWPVPPTPGWALRRSARSRRCCWTERRAAGISALTTSCARRCGLASVGAASTSRCQQDRRS